MKGLVLALMLVLTLGLASVTSASAPVGHAASPKAKKCKHGWILRKGKCRKKTAPSVPTFVPPPSPPPHALVRATLNWDGPALLWLQVWGTQGRAGYFPDDGGVLNEIPNAQYSGDSGGPGPRTETFTDDLFQGDYGSVPNPNSNREFTFGECSSGSAGPESSHVTMTWVTSQGLVNHQSWTFDPSVYVGRSCVTLIN
jgi:hypothetical protein